MATAYESADVKCPFYQSSGKQQVICEGVEDGSTITNVWKDPKQCAGFKRRYCKSDYRRCEIYRMLSRKY